VLESVKPHTVKRFVSAGDMVVLVSDGVSDVLGGDIIDIIKFAQKINPQALSDEIMSSALLKNGGIALDDMTVVCVRVFENV
jgi:serine/threonine protein phosphatase PrpC